MPVLRPDLCARWGRALNLPQAATNWLPWGDDPIAARYGVSFDSAQAAPITAPSGHYRICAYHIDHDQRPTCYQDVTSREEALHIAENLATCAGPWNVDWTIVFDDAGQIVA